MRKRYIRTSEGSDSLYEYGDDLLQGGSFKLQFRQFSDSLGDFSLTFD